MEGRQPSGSAASQQPQLVGRMQGLLNTLGVEEYEPRVVNQLIDFVYRYLTDALQEAESYSIHAGKAPGHVDLEDVMLAVHARSVFAFSQPPDIDEITSLAAATNGKDLPRFPAARHGLLIPDDKECLTAQNYAFPTTN